MGGACWTHERDENAYSIFIGKPEGKRPLGGLRRRLKDNIRMHLREIIWKGMD
jgi:hypothetical protein